MTATLEIVPSVLDRIRLTRKGNDWSGRYPLVLQAVNHLKCGHA